MDSLYKLILKPGVGDHKFQNDTKVSLLFYLWLIFFFKCGIFKPDVFIQVDNNQFFK